MNNPHYLKPAKTSPLVEKKKRSGEEGVAKLDVSSIPVSKLELGVDLVIGQFGHMTTNSLTHTYTTTVALEMYRMYTCTGEYMYLCT